MLQELGWIDAGLSTGGKITSIATLGPAGTSSEQAALYLWADRGQNAPPSIQLHDTYEAAGEALRAKNASHVVVANAYAGIHSFYMDPSLFFAGAFLFDTPHYGIAISPGHRVPAKARIATHPAPVALVGELLPKEYAVGEILYATSTSAAAGQAHRRETDLALTTQPAAKAHALEFISRTRTIRMLWSVFALGGPAEKDKD
jgi:prephenate dehydratase